jgi:nucleoid-associated protein YgaU
VVRLKTSTKKPKTTSTSKKPRSETKTTKSEDYTVKAGDCLWNIAKAKYGDGSLWTKIYEANKSVIESTAKSRGMGSSSNGHWIFPNTKLTIPAK